MHKMISVPTPSLLGSGDGGGGATSQKFKKFHFREDNSWIKNNNSQVASDVRIESVEPPSALKGKPEEGFPPIKQLIPYRAALISAKLNEKEASNPSIPIIHLEPDASKPLFVEGGGGGAASSLSQKPQGVNAPQKQVAYDGTIREGYFKDGKLYGAGKITLPNGTSITGEFRQGYPIGVCTETNKNGRKTEYQKTYTGADKEITRAELNRRMAAPEFVKLLTGVGYEGAISGYVLPLVSTHLKSLAPEKSQMEKLASQLDFAAEIQNEEAAISIGKIKGKLAAADKEVVIPYGRHKHAMLLKLKFTDSGLNVEIYNSGEGLLKHHDKHPEPGVNKYNTCKEKHYPNMRPYSTEFNTLLTEIVIYKKFKTIDESYAVFARAQDVVSVAPNWQRDQKARNCSLECVMAFLKKNMPPADYLQYRMTLISDVQTQAEVHKESYEEKLSQTVSNRLDEMLENRKVKQILYRSEPVDNNPALVESGAHISLSALRALLSNSEETPRAKQIAAGVHIPLSALLRDQQATPGAKEGAARALRNFSHNPANRQRLMDADVHIPLSALLSDQHATHEAKQWAAGALRNLSIDPDNRQPLVDAGVHIPLSELLIDPQATPVAKQWAPVALANLSENPANRQPLVDAGVHNQLSALLSDPQATPLAKQWAAGALENLSADRANRQILVADGVHNQLSALLSGPLATPLARKLAARALENLSENPVNSPILVDAGVHNQLSALLIDQWDAQPLYNLEPTPRGCCVIS